MYIRLDANSGRNDDTMVPEKALGRNVELLDRQCRSGARFLVAAGVHETVIFNPHRSFRVCKIQAGVKIYPTGGREGRRTTYSTREAVA
jgi:hypothetical protein